MTSESGRVEQMLVLAASRTQTAQYFYKLLQLASGLAIMCGRHQFGGVKAGNSPDDGHIVLYLGTNPQTFERVFESLGSIFITPRLAQYPNHVATVAGAVDGMLPL